MFGLKTMAVVGGGAMAALWAMNAASASSDDTPSVPGGVSGAAVSINPSSARPGQQVTITAPTCIQPTSGTASSVVFANNGTIAMTRNPTGPGLAGTGTIAANAQNGSNWSVNVTCGSGAGAVNGVTNITVYGGANPVPTQTYTYAPSRGPKAGGGGSIQKGDLGLTAGGIALVGGGVGYGVWSMRRREAASGTHVG